MRRVEKVYSPNGPWRGYHRWSCDWGRLFWLMTAFFMFQLKIEHPWYGCARLVNKSNDQNHIYSKHLNTKLEKTWACKGNGISWASLLIDQFQYLILETVCTAFSWERIYWMSSISISSTSATNIFTIDICFAKVSSPYGVWHTLYDTGRVHIPSLFKHFNMVWSEEFLTFPLFKNLG